MPAASSLFRVLVVASSLTAACGGDPARDGGTDAPVDAPAQDTQAQDTQAPSDGAAGDVTSTVDAAGNDVAANDVATTDVAATDVVAMDVVAMDVATDGATADAVAGDAASSDAGDGGSVIGTACTTDDTCGANSCLLGRCTQIADESIPVATLPSPDRCRVRIGVHYPSGEPLRILGVTSDGDAIEASRTGTTWTRTMVTSSAHPYFTPRYRRAMSGALETDFVAGGSVYVGSPRGVISARMLSGYDAEDSPLGDVFVATKVEEMGTFSSRYPVRLWDQRSGTWASDLVVDSIGTDGIPELRFRADGTPEVLVFQNTRVSLYRKRLDVWTSSDVYTGPGTHAGGEVTLNAPDGTTHVVMGTRTFMTDPSVGELTVDYLRLDPSGAEVRRERIPVGGYGFTLRGATLGSDGDVFVMISGRSSGGRYPTHVARVGASSGVTSSVVANFETSVDVCGLAVAPDQTMYLAAYQGFARPVLLRTYTPR